MRDGAPDRLSVWSGTIDWSAPSLSVTHDSDLTTASFSSNLCGGSWNCIPQPGTTVGLEPLSDRLMHRLAYRNFGGWQTMVVDHTVNAGVEPRRHPVVRARPTPAAAGGSTSRGRTRPTDGLHRWMGSIAQDSSGDIGLGYSVSSSTTYPSIRYTGRLATDPPGHAAAGRGVDRRRRRLAAQRLEPLGRLLGDVDRPERRLHVLVHDRSTTRDRRRELAHPDRRVPLPRLRAAASASATSASAASAATSAASLRPVRQLDRRRASRRRTSRRSSTRTTASSRTTSPFRPARPGRSTASTPPASTSTAPGPAASVNVRFFSNGAGDLPGTLVAERLAQSYGGDDGNFEIDLASPVGLRAGTYWVSVQANQDFDAGRPVGLDDPLRAVRERRCLPERRRRLRHRLHDLDAERRLRIRPGRAGSGLPASRHERATALLRHLRLHLLLLRHHRRRHHLRHRLRLHLRRLRLHHRHPTSTTASTTTSTSTSASATTAASTTDGCAAACRG